MPDRYTKNKNDKYIWDCSTSFIIIIIDGKIVRSNTIRYLYMINKAFYLMNLK